MDKQFVVVSDTPDGPVFWSNESGWGSFQGCDVFSEEEKNSFNLPGNKPYKVSWLELGEMD